MFLMSSEELWGFAGISEWLVGLYRLAPVAE